jgi:hypothetical protein
VPLCLIICVRRWVERGGCKDRPLEATHVNILTRSRDSKDQLVSGIVDHILCPQNQVQQGNQRQHFQQRSPYQQPGGQQTPRSGNPNATPIKNSAPNTPTRCFRCGKERHMSFNCPEKQNQHQSYSSNQKPTQYGKAPKVMLGTFNITYTHIRLLLLRSRISKHLKGIAATKSQHNMGR